MEKETVKIFEDELRDKGYFEDCSLIKKDRVYLKENDITKDKIEDLLSNSSKNKTGNQGYPDFILYSEKYQDFIIIVECKASITDWKKSVNESIWYGNYLKNDYNVVAIGVSGQTNRNFEISVNVFIKADKKNKKGLVALKNKNKILLSFQNYYDAYLEIAVTENYQYLLDYAQKLNEDLHIKKVDENSRCLLLSAILIALKNKDFKNSYKDKNHKIPLSERLITTVETELNSRNIKGIKQQTLMTAYKFIEVHNAFLKEEGIDYLISLIESINDEINNNFHRKGNKYYDYLGRFYIEFLSYSNKDKQFGIVLTPLHITEFACDLLEVNSKSVVIDNCCGTGGFLISAMDKMLKDTIDLEEQKHIREKQLIGIEESNNVFPMVCSNMIIHNDGQTNLIRSDCFKLSKDEKDQIRDLKPNIGLLNPPFHLKKQEDQHELDFIENNLSFLQTGGLCFAIVPMSVALAQSGKGLEHKRRLLEKHTLEAVLSLPNELFGDDANVVVCAMIIRANIPHSDSKETFFGYFKDDGFIKTKKGRVNKGDWKFIKETWIETFQNRKTKAGLSVMQKVSYDDEWCAEAYMETDYSTLTKDDFMKTIKDYIAFDFLFNQDNNED